MDPNSLQKNKQYRLQTFQYLLNSYCEQDSSQGTKHESATFSQKANAKSAMETSHIAYQDKVLDTTGSRKNDVYGVMRLTRPDTGTLCGKRFNSKQWPLLKIQ